jgi:hypothetical protein
MIPTFNRFTQAPLFLAHMPLSRDTREYALIGGGTLRNSDINLLFNYLYWANWRLLDHAERLSVDEFLASSGVTMHDLHTTLVHELDVRLTETSS